MRERHSPRSTLRAASLAVLLLVAGRGGASAQKTVQGMAAECAAADPLLQPLCLEGALALQAARGGVGLAAASLGTPVPGSTSTLGRRLGRSPRLALSVRGGFTHARMPDPRGGGVPADPRTFWARTLTAGVTVGVLDGFSLIPTVGGLLSLDLFGSATMVGLSSGSGFTGSVEGLGYGVRLGLLRESFTLPGVSVSVVRHQMAEAEWGRAGADEVSLVFKPSVTSVRAAAGKDLLAFGVFGGWGWERYCGSTALTARVAGVAGTGQASSGGFTSDRQVFFGGLSYTFLVLQFSAEGGYATGWTEVAGRSSGGYDPTEGSLFGSVAGRLTW